MKQNSISNDVIIKRNENMSSLEKKVILEIN